MILTIPTITIVTFLICMVCFLQTRSHRTGHRNCIVPREPHWNSAAMFLPDGAWDGKSTGGLGYSTAIMPLSSSKINSRRLLLIPREEGRTTLCLMHIHRF